MEKETLKQRADRLFAKSVHKKLWANPRGEFFSSENLGKLSLKKGETLTPFVRGEKATTTQTASNDNTPAMNAKDTITAIGNTQTLEELKAFEGDERVTVQRAYETKHAELLAAIEVNEELEDGAGQNPAGAGEEE